MRRQMALFVALLFLILALTTGSASGRPTRTLAWYWSERSAETTVIAHEHWGKKFLVRCTGLGTPRNGGSALLFRQFKCRVTSPVTGSYYTFKLLVTGKYSFHVWAISPTVYDP